MIDRNPAGGYLIRFETADGIIKWRNVPSLDHAVLCSAGGLDPCITWFDVSQSFTGGSGRGSRRADGAIHQGGRDAPPVGKITLVEQGEKFAEEDFREMKARLGWRAA